MALTIEQAAEVLGVSPYVVRAEIGRGKLSAYRVGQKRILIEEAEIEEYKQRNRVSPMPTAPKVAKNRYIYKLGDKVV